MPSRTITELEEEVLAVFHGVYDEEELQDIARGGSTWFPQWYRMAMGIVPTEPEALLQIALSHLDFFTEGTTTESLDILEKVSPYYLVQQNIVWYLDSYLSQYWKREYLKRERGAK